MRVISLLLGVALIAVVLWDAFETVVLPRTVSRRLRLTRIYLRTTWLTWRRIASAIGSDAGRERFLAVYGPVSLLGLSVVWAAGLVTGFAMLQWSAGSHLVTVSGDRATFLEDLYMSGTTFFTLGLGDVHPVGRIARALTVAESGVGFGFLALVIAYFPVLYQAFARREVRLTLLDAWAGSPPAAVEVLRRVAAAGDLSPLGDFLREWEYWCSEVLESHISYPALAYFRSQHQRQSWISALTTVLDVSALTKVGLVGVSAWRAHLTFAIARHAAVDLAQVFGLRPDRDVDRLSPDERAALRRDLEAAGLKPNDSPDADAELDRLRRSYEPYVAALSKLLLMPLPPWRHASGVRFNWHTSPKRDGGAHL